MTEKFIKAYNEFENLLRKERQMPPLEYEEHLVPVEMNKLKLCRICRNYIQHNDKDFFKPSAEMTKFIVYLTNGIKSGITTVKDSMSKVKPLTIEDDIVTAAKRLERLPFVPVVKEGVCVGVVTDETIRKACVKGANKLKEVNLSTINYVGKGTFLKDAPNEAVVTDNGKSKGKYLGVLRK